MKMKRLRRQNRHTASARAVGNASPLHRQVLDSLSEAFMQGDFVPGQKLTLRDLARSLETSIAPVREAISRLSGLGVVTVHPKRHIEVESLTPESYVELVEIRKLLEGHAAAQAAKRATTAEVDALAAINRKLLRLAKAGKVRRAMKENQRFHFAIYRAARSQALLDGIQNLWLRVGPALNMLLTEAFSHDERSLAEGFEHHDVVIRALREHDSAAALRAVTSDIETSANYLLAALRRQLPSTSETVAVVGRGNRTVRKRKSAQRGSSKRPDS
jgi:DNA-binding GntR family transcriptional regulator